MNGKTFEEQTKLMWEVMLLFSGAAVVLLLTAVERWDQINFFSSGTTQFVPITGWFGVWLVLQFASAIFALLLFVAKEWRQVPFADKSKLFFGFSTIAWVSLLSLDMRLVRYATGYWHGIVIALGVLLLTVFLITRLKPRTKGEIFP